MTLMAIPDEHYQVFRKMVAKLQIHFGEIKTIEECEKLLDEALEAHSREWARASGGHPKGMGTCG